MNSDTRLSKVILIQPTMGLAGEYVRHIPLSLLFVAAALKDIPVQIEIIDTRLDPGGWRETLAAHLDADVVFVGLTVMSGAPVKHALEISRFVRSQGKTPIVWGGSLPTIAPETVLSDEHIDYIVAGSGMEAVKKLGAFLLSGGQDPKELGAIPGLGYKRDGRLIFNPRFHGFEPVFYRDIPYSLIKDFTAYGQIGSHERVIPIYSAFGCPYGCTFCISPALYRGFPKKWLPFAAQETVDHIEYLMREYGATEVYFYDDDSFVHLDHVRGILREIKHRHLKIRLSFRGARVDEILRMDSAFLDELSEAGTPVLHIGIESGSQRVLDLFGKNITVDEILRMNRKLASHPRIIAAYNWIIGTPGETADEIEQTMDLIWKLVNDNPRCFFFNPNKFHPIPGTPMAALAEEKGYQLPRKLEEYIAEETEGDKDEPWYNPRIRRLIKMLQVTWYFVDAKAAIFLKANDWKTRLLRLGFALYRQIARFRFRYKADRFLLEYPLFQWLVHRIRI